MVIRKATADDAPFLAPLLFSAMEDIVYRFIGTRNPEDAKAFMLHFAERPHNQYSYQNCWVVEMEQSIAAAANVYDGARLHTLRQPVADYTNSRYSKDFQPEDETGPGEYYIDTLAVHPDKQGKGIGTALLQFLIHEYAAVRGKPLGLLVDEENPDARRLYIKLGFTPVGKRVIFGKRMEHLQLKGTLIDSM